MCCVMAGGVGLCTAVTRKEGICQGGRHTVGLSVDTIVVANVTRSEYFIVRAGVLLMGFRDVAFLPPLATFPPHFLKIVLALCKAYRPPHVLGLWLGVSKGMLPAKYFCSNKAIFMSIECH